MCAVSQKKELETVALFANFIGGILREGKKTKKNKPCPAPKL